MRSDERGRPTANRAASKSQLATGDYPDGTTGVDLLAWIRDEVARDPRKALRREQKRQARRERHFQSFVEAEPASPSSWGMTAEQLSDYAMHLRRQGWSDWEIRARLADPRQVAA